METDINNNKYQSKQIFQNLAFICGTISLCGLICCLPFMAPIGGLGILFAVLSRGNDKTFDDKAKKGIIFSIIGMLTSIVLTAGILFYSFQSFKDEIISNDNYVQEMKEEYENILEQSGVEMTPELEQTFEMLEEYADDLRQK